MYFNSHYRNCLSLSKPGFRVYPSQCQNSREPPPAAPDSQTAVETVQEEQNNEINKRSPISPDQRYPITIEVMSSSFVTIKMYAVKNS